MKQFFIHVQSFISKITQKSIELLYKNQKEITIALTIFLVALIILLIFVISILPVTSPSFIKRYNQNNYKYAHLSLAFDDFDLSKRHLNMDLSYWVCNEIRELYSGSEIPFRMKPYPYQPPYRYPSDPKTLSELTFEMEIIDIPIQPHEHKELSIELQGDAFLFPFDSYKNILGFVIPLNGDIDFKNTQYPYISGVPFSFTLVNNIRGYHITTVVFNNNTIGIEVQRLWFDKILFIVSIIMLCLIGIWFIYLSYKIREIHFTLVISGAALLIAIPSLRSALVPQQVQIRTILDIFFILPFVMLICGVLIIIFRKIYKKID